MLAKREVALRVNGLRVTTERRNAIRDSAQTKLKQLGEVQP